MKIKHQKRRTRPMKGLPTPRKMQLRARRVLVNVAAARARASRGR